MSRRAAELERADQAAIAAGLDHDRATLTGADASEAFTRSSR